MIDANCALLCPFTPLPIPYAKDIPWCCYVAAISQMIVYLDLSRASRAAGKSSALVRDIVRVVGRDSEMLMHL